MNQFQCTYLHQITYDASNPKISKPRKIFVTVNGFFARKKYVENVSLVSNTKKDDISSSYNEIRKISK